MDKHRGSYLYQELRYFLDHKLLDPADRILVVCGWTFDRDVLESLGFNNYLITNLLEPGDSQEIRNYQKEDAENLTFENGSFDNVLVHAGLHHCTSPHRALCEMYRVAKKNVIVFEAQDSFMMKFIVRFLGESLVYEFDAVDGLSQTIPNYVYRWTARELEKVIRSYSPLREPYIVFKSKFHFHDCYICSHDGNEISKNVLTRLFGKKLSLRMFNVVAKALNLLFRRQGNLFVALISQERSPLHAWAERYLQKPGSPPAQAFTRLPPRESATEPAGIFENA